MPKPTIKTTTTKRTRASKMATETETTAPAHGITNKPSSPWGCRNALLYNFYCCVPLMVMSNAKSTNPVTFAAMLSVNVASIDDFAANE